MELFSAVDDWPGVDKYRMRNFIDIARGYILKEAVFNDEEDEEDQQDFSMLPSSSILKELRPQLAAVAQAVYDEWEIKDGDEIAFQDEYAGGGICHLIADKMSDIIDAAGVPCSTVSSNYEQHVYCVAQCSNGVYEIDIPYRIYERGGGFTWTRIDGVTFTPDDVAISRLDIDPANVGVYWDRD